MKDSFPAYEMGKPLPAYTSSSAISLQEMHSDVARQLFWNVASHARYLSRSWQDVNAEI
jgi:hypothetical protein